MAISMGLENNKGEKIMLRYVLVYGFMVMSLVVNIFAVVQTDISVVDRTNFGKSYAFWKFNEFEGVTAYDSTSNKNDATIYGAKWASDGVQGSALKFDGKDDYVGLDAFSVNGYPFTLNAWIKASKIGKKDMVIVGLVDKDDKSIQYGIYLGEDEDGYVGIRARDKKTIYKFGKTVKAVDDGKWHLVTGVFKSEVSRELYVDGVLEATDTRKVVYSKKPDRINIGRWGDKTPKSYFNGTIDNVSVSAEVVPQPEAIKEYFDTYIEMVNKEPVVEYIIDNDDLECSKIGLWMSSTFAEGYYGNDYLASHSLAEAVYKTTLAQRTAYEVFVQYSAFPNRPVDTPVIITHDYGTSVVYVNQQENGGTWVSLGTYQFKNNPAKVKISSAYGSVIGHVVADAVRFLSTNKIPITTGETQPVTTILDNDSPLVTVNGYWPVSTWSYMKLGNSYLHDNNSVKGAKSIVYSPILTATDYEVCLWYSSNGENRSTNTPVTINHAIGTSTVIVDQTQNGGTWVSLGTFTFDGEDDTVVIGNTGTDGYVVADGVSFILPAENPNPDLDQYKLSISAGWNLLSVPFDNVDLRELQEAIGMGSLWTWKDGMYVLVEKPVAKEGLWFYSNVDTSVLIVGEPYVGASTFSLLEGWNLFGPVKDGSLAKKVGNVFGYKGEYVSFKPGDVLFRGRGYWIYSSKKQEVDLQGFLVNTKVSPEI